jgi:hypothetical protein
MKHLITMNGLCFLMGLGKVSTLDVSAYEGAEITADLNYPVPDELLNRFGLIIDGGTIEHVFDIRQGMANTANMLRVDGRALHISPSNNYFNHGFVQVSPTFYHDFYTENEFSDVDGLIVVQPRANYFNLPWKVISYRPDVHGGVNSIFCSEDTMLVVMFSARKTLNSTASRIPIQSWFKRSLHQMNEENYQFIIKYDPINPTLLRLDEPPAQEDIADLAVVMKF